MIQIMEKFPYVPVVKISKHISMNVECISLKKEKEVSSANWAR